MHILKAHIVDEELTEYGDAKTRMLDFAERIREDYFPVNYGCVTPLAFIDVGKGMTELLKDWCPPEGRSVDLINKHFNECYGPKAIEAARKRVLNVVGNPLTDDNIRKVIGAMEILRYGADFIHKDIDIRTDDYNPYGFANTNGPCSVTDMCDYQAFTSEVNLPNDDSHLYLLVVDAQI